MLLRNLYFNFFVIFFYFNFLNFFYLTKFILLKIYRFTFAYFR